MLNVQVYILSSLILVTFSGCINAVEYNGCVVPFSSKKDWHIFWPIMYRTNGLLYDTTEVSHNNDDKSTSMVLVKAGDEVLISCSPNYVKERPPTEYVNAVCQNDGKFLVKGGTSVLKTIHDLRCDLRAIEEVLENVSDCPTSSTSVQFGYVNPIDQLSYIVGEACYDTQKGQTRFAHVYLSSNNNANSSATALRISQKSFFKKPHPELGYKSEFMRASQHEEYFERFVNIYKVHDKDVPWFEVENYINENLLGNQQFYAVRKLSWNYLVLHQDLVNIKRLKEDISKLNDVHVYIGSHGVTKFKDASGDDISIYLKNEKFPVPEIVWIIVKKDEKATAFAVFNNPLLTIDDITNNSFCQKSKCEEITWLKKTGKKDVYMNVKHGAIICCDYNEFKKSVEEVPNLKNIKDIYL